MATLTQLASLYLYRAALFLFLLAGCSHDERQKQERTFPVEVAEAVVEDEVPIYVDLIGSAISPQIVNIRPQVSGIVEEAFVEEGATVKAGDPLFKIDPRRYEASVKRAEANVVKSKAALAFANTRLERYADLVKQEYFSKLNYEEYGSNAEAAEAQIASDEADLALQQLNLDWCTVRSPLSGKVSEFGIDVGNLVVTNDTTALVTVRQIDPLDIAFNINQATFTGVQEILEKEDLKFQVFLPQKMSTPREGKVYFINNQFDPTTGTIAVKGSVDNSDEFFWPGEFVRVHLQVHTRRQAVVVPAEAVQFGQRGAYVYIYDPSTSQVEYRSVVKGETFGEGDSKVIIVKGVRGGEIVVREGQINLRPGSKVYIPEKS